jgi:hypothetical protein
MLDAGLIVDSEAPYGNEAAEFRHRAERLRDRIAQIDDAEVIRQLTKLVDALLAHAFEAATG